MQLDDLDKAIKDAADHHHPAYDEQAWKKMEKLLDTHLPQKKDDRRRIIFFLLLFLLLGAGGWLFISKPWQSAKQVSSLVQKGQPAIYSQPPVNTDLPGKEKTASTTVAATNKEQKEELAGQEKKNKPSSFTSDRQQRITASQNIINGRQKKTAETNLADQLNPSRDNSNSSAITVIPDQSNGTQPLLFNGDQKNNNNPVTENPVVTNNPTQENVPLPKTAEEQKATDKNELQNNLLTSVAATVSKKNKKGNSLMFSVSAGPDISKARSGNTGQLTGTYGAGVSYTMNRFSLRSGFYVARKIYSAGPEDYKLSYSLPPSIKLLHVDADCKVFEIPLDLVYNFGVKSNNNWYAGIGFSSYLMKKENYNNLYQYTSSGQTYYRSFSYNNENKNFLSVLHLSAGFTHNLSKTFSLSAEPYLKIPIKGIGEGNVHLNSAGILFTAGIKPFQPKKHK